VRCGGGRQLLMGLLIKVIKGAKGAPVGGAKDVEDKDKAVRRRVKVEVAAMLMEEQAAFQAME
jgi:hypothetical protein